MEKGDIALVITLSGKLSGTWQSAMIAAKNFSDSVYVVDSENVSVGEHVLIDYAFRLIDSGLPPAAIVEKLDILKKRIRLIALLDTLEYLKKGGRISSAAALAGNILSIRPVIAIEHGEVSILGKARGSKQANNLIVEQIRDAGGIDFSMPYYLGYTGLSRDLIQKYMDDNAALWESETDHLPVESVGGTIGTHAGPGAIAVAFVAKENRN